MFILCLFYIAHVLFWHLFYIYFKTDAYVYYAYMHIYISNLLNIFVKILIGFIVDITYQQLEFMLQEWQIRMYRLEIDHFVHCIPYDGTTVPLHTITIQVSQP